ncbi:transcriptional regulator [Stappia stellulata]|uniref:transcriptional regulator n=1 Tax=Stappia stellulata TaxID=71235 RepID=UPI000403A69E
MFEQRGCEWCERWNAEIGPIYPKTEEGKLAPLRRVDIHEKMPEDLAWLRREVFTPSFALVHEGREYGRIRGYPGEDFFWGLLGQMVEKFRQRTGDGARLRTDTPSPG